MKTNFGIKEVVAVGIGTALFVVLTQVQIPIGIPNTYLQPRMAVLAFIAAVFGPVAGAVVGLLGHALGDAFFYGSIWWSWVVPELIVGAGIGCLARKYMVKEGNFGVKEIMLFNVAQVAANVLAWIVVAPSLDIIIYSEPLDKLFLQGGFACLGNVLIIGILGSVLLAGYSKIGARTSSLTKEN